MSQLYKLTACAFILDKQGRLLIVKRREDDPLLPGYWQAPGGAIDGTISIENHLATITRDQTGLDITCDKLFGYFMFQDAKNQPAINLNFLCSMNDPAQFVTLGQTMTEEAWIDMSDLTNYMLSPEMFEACRWALGKVSADRR